MDTFIPFPKTSRGDWLAKIEQDLKGRPYHDLIHSSPEGIDIHPVYTAEDRRPSSSLTGRAKWHVQQSFFLDDQAHIEAALMAGVDTLHLHVNSSEALQQLCAGILPAHVHLRVEGPAQVLPGFLDILYSSTDAPLAPDFLYDHGEALAIESDIQEDLRSMMESASSYPDMGLVLIDGHRYHSAGADHVEEMALALMEAKHAIEVGGCPPSKLRFRLAVDRDYYMSIAKLRAFRILWANMLRALDLDSAPAHIEAKHSHWEHSPVDRDGNLLRMSTQAMSAILGGADQVDLGLHDADEKAKAYRMARNIQFLLRHESHLDKMADVHEGAYLFESLIADATNQTWNRMKAIEAEAGWASALQSGELGQRLKETAEKKAEAMIDGSRLWLGANRYPLHADLKLSVEWSKEPGSAGLYPPILKPRGQN
jgi:methylmalonyl-CoA mutase